MKIHLKALGCRLNEAELEQWSREFTGEGHSIVKDAEVADVVVVNTCAVTTEATKKSRKLMNRLHRENPQSKLVVSGCYATLEEQEVAKRIGVDLVVNNQDKDLLPRKVMDEFSANTMPLNAMEPDQSSLFLRGKQRAFIKIQDGCRYRCTYCIVTVARGEEKSRTLADIVEEVNHLHQQGIEEIVLTGVHVGGYGSDIGSSLTDLVKVLLAETDIPRIRFASVEPWDLPEDFFTLFENKRLMPHMHLPLQSGADSVLRRMSRRCKVADFSALINQARSSIPDFNVTTDIIVGFPGETDEEWSLTLENVESIGFGHMHIFAFSPREGTKAAGLQNQIAEDIKKQRSHELHLLAESLKKDFHQQQINQAVDVLWEGQKKNEEGRRVYSGYAPNFCRVESIGQNDVLLEGRVKQTQILGYSSDKSVLTGKVL
ncbi:tRNA (N(6)-L-threonylcarbamoyladenosine(37)-C(2))-methylthiotransferase MtaB [uncultured Cocleimonas sp.]|uniref:tRNA (N(6)-L-threonylcarbamoyladenosine(37)-C(2))- methylthiotransferase MtaB n=1 Tax=uncultured Cocleimonas sp. TaxID=1051587 RepID=UPI002621F2C1|nr:tRNA (N(6)-L-threonylcarbamoyladenosine(37)-C(2))-methylthiotransferase MtaB [uncultured Cocleimonas sp.]